MENLYSFYQSQGQALPSVKERQGVASQAGIQGYTGTAQQNTQLLGFLKNQKAPVSSSVVPITALGSSQVTVPAPTATVVQPQTNLATDIIAQTKTEATPLQGTQENLISKILENQLGLQGEAQAQADANLQAGVNTKIAELNDLNSKILQKQAEVQQDDITLVSQMRAEETRDTLLPFAQMGQAKLAGDAQIVRALKNAEIGVLNAQAIGKQGDVQLARDTAKQAVELKFAPYKERIALYQSQLEAIAPLLSREEKAQAREQDIKTKLALSKIDKLETFQSKALENAISNNAPQSVISKILNANSIEGITSVGGNYLVSKADKLEQQLKSMQISKLSSDIAKDKAGNLNAQGLRQLDDTEYSKFTANPNYKAVSDGTKYQRALADFKKAVEKYGTGEVLSATGKGQLGSAYSTLVATTKDYYTLGTLDEGVQKLVSLGVPEPTKLRIRDKRVLSAVDELSSQAQKSVDSAKNQLGKSVYGNTVEYQSLLEESGLNPQSTQISEVDYVNTLLNDATTSPFSVFGN